MRILFLLSLCLLFGSCVDIFDEIIVHADGSGTYKYTINLSASKVKINSILALDSVDGQRVPKLPEIKEKIELYRKKLAEKEGISNVTVDANYDDFLFKISLDFENVAALQEGIKEVVKENSQDKNDPAFNDTWISWDGKTLVRSIPNFKSFVAKLKPEDQEKLKTGKYNAVSRFDKAVLKCENPEALISPSKTAVMIKATSYQVGTNPLILKNTIQVAY
jgi:hypothetical protein